MRTIKPNFLIKAKLSSKKQAQLSALIEKLSHEEGDKRPHDQIVAIAYSKLGISKKKKKND